MLADVIQNMIISANKFFETHPGHCTGIKQSQEWIDER
jgi:hypothetical protein